jgi:hypothetical protein
MEPEEINSRLNLIIQKQKYLPQVHREPEGSQGLRIAARFGIARLASHAVTAQTSGIIMILCNKPLLDWLAMPLQHKHRV